MQCISSCFSLHLPASDSGERLHRYIKTAVLETTEVVLCRVTEMCLHNFQSQYIIQCDSVDGADDRASQVASKHRGPAIISYSRHLTGKTVHCQK